MSQGPGKDVRVYVHGLGEPLATPNRRASPKKVLGICIRTSTVRASGRVEMRRGLLGRSPRRASGDVLENTLCLVVKASQGRTYKVTVDVVQAPGMSAGLPSPTCAVGVAPVRRRIANMGPRRAQSMDRREAWSAQPQVFREGGTVLMELVKEEPHGRSERGGIGLRALIVQPDTLPDAPGSGACIVGVQDGAPQLGQAKVEDMHLRV